MSSVVGIDLSSRALDLVKLDEETNKASWTRVEPFGANSWARTLAIEPGVVFPGFAYWDDVYLVAIEAPYGRGQSRTLAVLNRVVGALAASLPRELRDPSRCWLVAPHEWKTGLGLTGKPTWQTLTRIVASPELHGPTVSADEMQHGLDAFALAYWARETNAKGIAVQPVQEQTA